MASLGLSPMPTGSNCVMSFSSPQADIGRASSSEIGVHSLHPPITNSTDVKVNEAALKLGRERPSSEQGTISIDARRDWQKRCGKVVLFTISEIGMAVLMICGLIEDNPGMAIGGACGGLAIAGGGLLMYMAE